MVEINWICHFPDAPWEATTLGSTIYKPASLRFMAQCPLPLTASISPHFLGTITVVYDYLLILGFEVKIIWPRKFWFLKFWYFAVRYSSLGFNVVIIFFYFGNLSPESCSRLESAFEAFLFLQESLVQASLVIRVFAMYRFNQRILASMLFVASVTAGLGLWTIIAYGKPQILTVPGMAGCHTVIPRASALRLAGAWEGKLAFDTLVFGLTLYRAYMELSTITVISGSLIERMARDGTMYFGFVLFSES
ncbi:hypothetical protein B0H13DRAFT_2047527 [Mycena leptocephala]|nr:hypothetical protein B0H13DRAFT_2047527 [Mycena leptocephala]